MVSIASGFRAKMDVALRSADDTRGLGSDARRTGLMQDLDRAGLVLIEKEMLISLMDRHTSPTPNTARE